jgi:hypothetical protein
MEDQNEGKIFHIENIAKNLWTTIIGGLIMAASALAFIAPWFVVLPVQPPEPWKLFLSFVAGFALLFMRDKITTYIDIFTRKKIDKE